MKSLFILLSFLITSFCLGQKAITGTVTGPDGETLIGVTISIKGTGNYTYTDFDGNYSIGALPEDVLVFSYTGYDTQEVVVGDQSVIDVKLKTDLTLQVAIVHYYDKKIEIKTDYGINYETYGLGIMKKFNYPYDFEVSTFLSSNFRDNKKFSFQIEKPLRIKSLLLIAGLKHEQADFESSNFKKNQLFLEKKFGRDRDPFQHIRIIVGQLKFENNVDDQNDLGLGFQLRKRIANGFYINTEYNYWNGRNEVILKNDYFIKYNWAVNLKYHHLRNYEELSIGISHSWGSW